MLAKLNMIKLTEYLNNAFRHDPKIDTWATYNDVPAHDYILNVTLKIPFKDYVTKKDINRRISYYELEDVPVKFIAKNILDNIQSCFEKEMEEGNDDLQN